MIHFLAMSRVKVTRQFLTSLCGVFALSLTTLSVAQAGAGGGAGTGGSGNNHTSYPWDPNNYTITSSEDGEDVVSWWTILNGQPTNQVTTYPWSGNQLPSGASNSTGTSRSGYMTSQGTATLTIQWVGNGPAPSKVLVMVYAPTLAGTTPSGSLSVDNGLGSLVTTSYDTLAFSVMSGQSGSLRYVSLDQTGKGTLQLSKQASASVVAGNNMNAYASAHGSNMSVVSRAVMVGGSPGPTYYSGYHDMPTANLTDDPHKLRMDIGVTVDNNTYMGNGAADLAAGLWGNWSNPLGSWQWTDTQEISWQNAGYRRQFSKSQIIDMMTSPQTETNAISVQDYDGFSDSGSVTLRIHAPWEFPEFTSEETKYSNWTALSAFVQRSPVAPVSVSSTSSYSMAISKSLTIGAKGNGTVIPAPHPLVLELNVSGSYGETATVTTLNTYLFSIPPGPATMKFRIEKRVFWKEQDGFYLGYGTNGYEGLKDMIYTHWVSATKLLAEQNDAEIKIAGYDINYNP